MFGNWLVSNVLGKHNTVSYRFYYICTKIYCKMNMLNKNDALQSTRNPIGCTIFLTSEKYRMTNHKPQTKVFTSDKNRVGFPAFH